MVSLKMMKPEIYDIFEDVMGLMISCKNDSFKKLTREVVLTFIQNYPLSEQLLDKILIRLINNMDYSEHEGRRVVINVLERLVDKLPLEAVKNQLEVMIYGFTARLVNEDVYEVKEYATSVFKLIIEKVRDSGDDEFSGLIPKLYDNCNTWLKNEVDSTRRAGLALLKILFWATGMYSRIESTLVDIIQQLEQTCEEISNFWEGLSTNMSLKDTLKENPWKDIFWDEGEFDSEHNLSKVKSTKVIVLDYISFIDEIILHDKTSDSVRNDLFRLLIKLSRHPDEEVQLSILHLTAKVIQRDNLRHIVKENLKGYLVFLFALVRSKHLHEDIIPVLETHFTKILSSYSQDIPKLRSMIITAVSNINFKYLRFSSKYASVVNKCVAISRLVIRLTDGKMDRDVMSQMITFFIRMLENGFIKESKESVERLELDMETIRDMCDDVDEYMRLCTSIRSEIYQKKYEYKSEKKQKAINDMDGFMKEKTDNKMKKKVRRQQKNIEKKFGMGTKQLKII